MTECQECGCQTGGAEYCYQHAPITIWPKKDGSYYRDTSGGRARVTCECPAAARLADAQQNSAAQFAHNTELQNRLTELEKDNDFQGEYLATLEGIVNGTGSAGFIGWNLDARVRDLKAHADGAAESLEWAIAQLQTLVTDDDGSGTFVRGTGTELVGFGDGLTRARQALQDLRNTSKK